MSVLCVFIMGVYDECVHDVRVRDVFFLCFHDVRDACVHYLGSLSVWVHDVGVVCS